MCIPLSAHTLGTLKDGFRAQVTSKKRTRLEPGNLRIREGITYAQGNTTEPRPQIWTGQVTPSLVLSGLACPVGRGLSMSLAHTPPPCCRPWAHRAHHLPPAAPVISRALEPADSWDRAHPPWGTRWTGLQGLLGTDMGAQRAWPLSVELVALGRHVAPCRRRSSEKGCPGPGQMRYKTGTCFSSF